MSFSEVLKESINSLAENGFIFSNESQFQFNLAWELQKKGYEVFFEVLASENDSFESFSSGKCKKSYIDLVVKGKDGNLFAIELKYKTPQKNYEYNTKRGKSYTFSQGAPDLGAFLFWEDVKRLEGLGTSNLVLNFNNDIKITKKYAILLTNDKNYWTESPKSLCKEFFPYKDKTASDRLCWHILIDKQSRERISGKSKRNESIEEYRICDLEDAKRYSYLNNKYKCVEPIIIKGNYTCKWFDYPCPTECLPSFRYLILEID